MKTREHWTKREWAMTIILCFIFPPIGLAALGRWIFKQCVWFPPEAR
jgi:hypothetical protein